MNLKQVQLSCRRALLDSGQVMHCERTTVQLVIKATLGDQLDALQSLIANGADVNEQDSEGRTALIHAAIDNQVNAAKLLIDAGASVNAQDRLGNAALHYAAQDFHLEFADMLVRNGASIDLVDKHGNTPLWRSVFYSKGRGQMIALLLGAGADKTHKNNNGKSPLDLAKTIANYDIWQFLG